MHMQDQKWCCTALQMKATMTCSSDDGHLQAWAQLEEEQGLYPRASELRSYSLQEQTTFVGPQMLGTQLDDPPPPSPQSSSRLVAASIS